LSTSPGEAAENIAAAWLQQRGLRLLTRNFRCKAGEIDLVLEDGDQLVFAEVRYRSGRAFGGAAASIDAKKRQRIITAARYYLLARLRDKPEPPCRFDVIVLDRLDPAAVEWLRDAFGET
jgi:putative endonuclease